MPFDYQDNNLNTGLFETFNFFSGNTGDLTETSSGSGVHLLKDVIVNLGIVDRDSSPIHDEQSFLSSAYTNTVKIDILGITGDDVKTGYLVDHKSTFFTFNETDNINVFGDYAKHFGIRATVIARDNLENTSEFYFYGNVPVLSKVSVKDSTGTFFHSTPSSSKTEVNTTGQTGQITLTTTFANDMSYVKMKNLDVFITTGSSFDTASVGTTLFPEHTELIANRAIQNIFVDESKFPTGDHYLHLVPYSEIGSGISWTVGPYRIAKTPTTRSPFATTDESVLVYGEQTAAGDKTFVGERTVMGGSGHDIVASTTGNFIGGGRSNSITGVTPAFNFLGGGSGNSLITSDYSSLVGGLGNSITGGDFNFIGGGSGIDLKDSDYSIIVGGVDNITSGSTHCFIGGGEDNSVKNVSNSSIVGGSENKITGYIWGSFIGGGVGNRVDVEQSAIVGGVSNIITSGQGFNGWSFIGGGEGNEVHSQFGAVLGGENNRVSGSDSAIVGGSQNSLFGHHSLIAGAKDSITSGDYSVGLGRKTKILDGHSGAFVAGDGQDRDHFSSGEHTAVLDFASGVYITNDVFVAGDVEASEFIGDLRGAVSFKAKAGEALSAGEVVYISGINGNTTVVAKADADDPNKMPAFGVSKQTVNANANVLVANFGSVTNLDTSSYSEGDELFISDVAGQLTGVAPTGETSALQKMAKVTKSHASSGSITVMGAGRSNAVPNLNEGRLFVGNSSNKAVADGTIHVDIANSKVGIGTTTPNEKLTVSGNISAVSGTFTGKVTAEGGDSTKWNEAYTDRTLFSVIIGTGGEIHSRYKSGGWLKSEIDAIDTSFGASDIEAVIFGAEVPTIEGGILKNQVGLKFVDFGKLPTVILDACRGCSSLERVIMRATDKVGQHAFNGCSSLTDIDLGSVDSIGNYAFRNCASLTSVNIPPTVTFLGINVFHGCTSLSEVNCYANYSVFNTNVFKNTASPLTIHAKPNTGWTAASGISFQGNPNVTIILDLV